MTSFFSSFYLFFLVCFFFLSLSLSFLFCFYFYRILRFNDTLTFALCRPLKNVFVYRRGKKVLLASFR
uniref:Uncharacterized protein n=1 Tax=Daphnia magna TaxID=35525 RepID=A0A0N8EDR7_9CRUS